MEEQGTPANTFIALTIAGSDSGGGAGIQADLKTFSASGVYGASVVTAITAQNTQSVTAVHEVPVEVISAQIKAVLDDIAVNAIKIGMLSSASIIEAVVKGLAGSRIPIVCDPVMVAKSGDRLLRSDAIQALKANLLPISSLLTPNLPEAADLLETDEADSEDEMLDQARALLELGPKAVLMKGGHAEGETCVDLLVSDRGEVLRLTAPRLDSVNTHGTGCTLSAAIAAGLARGKPLEMAVAAAHTYLQSAISEADSLSIGHGHGPVHHFHGIWT